MATQLTDEELFSALDADHSYGTKTEAARSLGLTRKGLRQTVSARTTSDRFLPYPNCQIHVAAPR